MDILLVITEFIGRFHPVLVHLPIGILLLAAFLHLLSYKSKFETLQPAVKLSLLIGAIAATVSCITGWLLSSAGEYDDGLVSKHQWLGIAVAILSFLAWYLSRNNHKHLKWLILLMVLLITITGHLGGTLTHGEGFLTQGLLSDETKNSFAIKPIADVQQAVAYKDIIQPILQSKCYSCHGTSKQKGKLRLDEPFFIDKGGEGGKVLIAGNAGESELIIRLLLPRDNKDHMPPKQKTPLTKSEIELMHWWVSVGANYDKKIAQLVQPEKVKPYLLSLQTGKLNNKDSVILDIPNEKVEKASDDIINKLKQLNVSVNQVSQNSNYLTVNFVAVDSVTEKLARLLQQVGKQIAWLNLGNTRINDSVMSIVGKLPSLTRLFLNNSNVTDRNILFLDNLVNLQYLNLSSTAVTEKGITSLTRLKLLRHLFLFRTGVKEEGFGNLKKLFPLAFINIGSYTLQLLQTDTAIVKEKPRKG